MICVYCSSLLQVVNSRPQKALNQVWRRRQCRKCNAIFTSIEAIDYAKALAVQGKTGRPAPFSRDQLFISILKSCLHRPDAIADAGALTGTVTAQLVNLADEGMLTTDDIAGTVLKILRRYDTPAAVQYKAYHQENFRK